MVLFFFLIIFNKLFYLHVVRTRIVCVKNPSKIIPTNSSTTWNHTRWTGAVLMSTRCTRALDRCICSYTRAFAEFSGKNLVRSSCPPTVLSRYIYWVSLRVPIYNIIYFYLIYLCFPHQYTYTMYFFSRKWKPLCSNPAVPKVYSVRQSQYVSASYVNILYLRHCCTKICSLKVISYAYKISLKIQRKIYILLY